MTGPTDADLVRRAQGGNVNAIGELYDRHHTRIFRYLWSRVRDRHLAEDLTGEVFVRMVTHLSSYRLAGTPFQAWLYRLAHNVAVDHVRKQSHHPLAPLYYAEGMEGAKQDPTAIVERKLSADRVEAALSQLDPSQQEVVVLRFLVGLSLKEVAAALHKTVAAVKSLQHRGLATLRAALEEG